MAKRVLRIAAILVAATAAATAAAVWLTVRDVAAELRSSLAASRPLPPLMRAAIIAAEEPVLEMRTVSLRALLPQPEGTVNCGPSPVAWHLVRSMSPRRRPLRWHAQTIIRTWAVSRMFTAEELLRIYGHRVYLGRGVEGVEAAAIAAMIRSPHVYAPSTARGRERCERVLQRMVRLGYI